MTLQYIFHLIGQERIRQDRLVEEGKFPFNCSDRQVEDNDKLPILGEEFGEVSKEVYEGSAASTPDQLRVARQRLAVELVQVSAVCVSWLQSLETIDPNAIADSKSQVEKTDDPLRSAQKLLRDGELKRVPAYLVGQLKERLENFNRQTNEWKKPARTE